MSLRAKIEAVIYAAEEPVTLAQLTSLFRDEALAEGHALEPAEPSSAEEVLLFAPAEDPIEPPIEQEHLPPATAPANVSDPDPDAEAMLEQKRLERIRDRQARDQIRSVLDELIAEYDRGDRGMEIREIAGGYRVATRPEYHDAVRSFVKSLKPVMKLTLQALETLAVIAYKQPVTAPEVSEIRGVDSGGVLASLISRKLVTTAGRKQVIGRPILYKTTKEFLLRFGLKDISELPSMEEFEKMAGELAELEDAQQLDLPAAGSAQTPADNQPDHPDQGVPPMESVELEQSPHAVLAVLGEPSDAADVHAFPERLEELDEEQIRANARAAVCVDDESLHGHDLPGVHRDTAGKLDIDSVTHKAPPDWDTDEGNY